MEDDDETTSTSISQMLNDNSIASLLYCDEDPLVSATPPPPQQQQQPSSVLATVVVGGVEEEDHLKELLVDYMARQRFYAPTKGYLEHLLTPLPPPPPPPQQQGSAPPEPAIASGSVYDARSRGVHYIIYAFGRLGLMVGTVFNAVNYLDRFLSINCHLRWESWMVELVSVACLSIACKLDEVNIPSLHHLQSNHVEFKLHFPAFLVEHVNMEEVMNHSFLPATVRDMELTLLKALQWRLACVTPYSFLHLLLHLTPHTTTAVASRCTRLLIRSLSEPSLIQFDPSVITSSALGCVLAALQLGDHHQIYGYISLFIPPDCPAATAMTMQVAEAHDLDGCLRMMETLYACCSESDSNWNTHHHQLYSSGDERLWSPVPVTRRRTLELQTEGGGDRLFNNNRSAVRRRCLFGPSASASASAPTPAPQGSRQLQDDNADNTHVRDEDISHTHN